LKKKEYKMNDPIHTPSIIKEGLEIKREKYIYVSEDILKKSLDYCFWW